MNRDANTLNPIIKVSKIFTGGRPSLERRVELQGLHTQLSEEHPSLKAASNTPAEQSLKPLQRGIVSLAAVSDTALITPILKTTSSLGSLSHCQRKVQIDLGRNEQMEVDNWKEVTRNNTFQMDKENERSCCCIS